MWLFFIDSFWEWTWIRLSSIKVNNSSDQLIPFFFVELPQMISNFHYQVVQRLDSAVDVGFLRICDWTELMFFFDNFREIPQFGRSSHIFSLQTVVNGFHVLKCFCGTFQFLILTISSRKHSISDYGILDVLIDRWVNVFHFLDCLLNGRLFESGVTVVFPNPISAKFFHFRLDWILVHELLDFKVFHFGYFFGIA